MSGQPISDRTESTPLRRGCQWLAWPVWNRDERRLRAPIRALLPLIATFLTLGAIQTLVRPRFDGKLVVGALETTLLLATLTVAIVLGARLLDRRPVAEYGLDFDREWGRSFLVGGGIATAANAGTCIVALAAGWATVDGVTRGAGPLSFLPAVLLVFGYIAVAASWEEFIFRGAMLQNLSEGADGYLPRWLAVALALLASTTVFAFMHSGKVAHPSQAGYYAVAGLVLGGVYVLSGDLALPVGFHVFYNFTMSAVFGLGASQGTPELLALSVTGPAFWIGEEGVARVVFAVVGGVLLVAYVRWRDGRLTLADSVPQWTPRDSARAPEES